MAFLGFAALQQAHIVYGVIALGVVLGVDVLSVVLLKQRLVKDPKIWRFIWVALLSQAVSLPLLIQSVFSDKVLWRGQWLSVAETE